MSKVVKTIYLNKDIKMQVRLFKPSLGSEEIAAIQEVFENAWIGLGPKVLAFEKAWSEYLTVEASVGVNSGTAALHLAVKAFGFAKGSKVLVPALTFISSALAAMLNDLEPVFVDIDPVTLSMDLEDLQRKITSDTVAIIAVHMAGHPIAMDQLMDIAQHKGLKVIEDCAHCTGGSYKGKKLGSWGDIGCFSFEEKKGMTTGDGGMICSDDADLIEPLRALRWVGIDKDTWKRESSLKEGQINSMHWYYEISSVGLKYNMNDLSASIGLTQLKKLDTFNANKRQAIARYCNGISSIDNLEPLLPYRPEGENAYWIFGIRTHDREALIGHLKKLGVATGVHYMPLPMHPLFEGCTDEIPVAMEVYPSMLSLPLYPDISNEEVDYVLEQLSSFYKE